MMKKHAPANGYILIEILVSLVIFAAGILFLIQALSRITRSNLQLRNNQIAVMLIDNMFNRLYSGEEFSERNDTTVSGKVFSPSIDITTLTDNFKKVSIKVSWQERRRTISTSFTHVMIDPL